jgi:hypothetical protein
VAVIGSVSRLVPGAGQFQRAAVYPVETGAATPASRREEHARMRSIVTAVLGGALGFAATFLAIGAIVLLGTGVAGGVLVRERPGTARVLNYDPSDTVLKAAVLGGAALVLAALFLAIYLRLRRNDRRRWRMPT